MMQNYTRRRVHECAWSCSAVGAKRYRDAYRRLLNCEKAAPASGGPASCEAVAGPGPSIFKQFLDAAFALFSRIASVTFAGRHDLTSVKIMSSMQQWRCAVLGILRLKRFAFSPLPRNLHRRPNVQHEPNVERASCECDILDIPFQIASRRSIRGKM